jgi:hypothetical protein
MRKKNLEGPIVFTRHENLYTRRPLVSTGAADTGVRNTAYRQPLQTRPPATKRRRHVADPQSSSLHTFQSMRSSAPCRPQPCRPQPCRPQPCRPQPCRPQPCRPQPYPCRARRGACKPSGRATFSRGRRRPASEHSRRRFVRPTRRAPPTHAVDRTAPFEPIGVIACTTRRGMPRRVRHAERRTGVSCPSSTIRRASRPLRPGFFPASSRSSAAVCIDDETPARCDPSMHPAASASCRSGARGRHCHFPLSGSPDPETRRGARRDHDTKPASRQRSLTHPGEGTRPASHVARVVPSTGPSCRAPPGWSTLVEYIGRMPASGGRAVRLGAHQRRNALER